ncbi:MAG: protoheme IX farnesyltransferase [Thermomicrobiales bacterium]|nr:protoheme IX farnesyltransferase [Thermomicrobiales bacterium]
MARLTRIALLAVLATFGLIVFGGLSRMQPDPGCADWPRCQGAWFPPLEPGLVVEWLHRAISASIGVVLLATALVAATTVGVSARTRAAAWSGVALVVAQSLVGALALGPAAPSWAGIVHLGLAMILVAVALLTWFSAAVDRGAPVWLASVAAPDRPADERFRRAAAIAAAAMFALILSVAASNAAGMAAACASWPLCPPETTSGALAADPGSIGFRFTTLASAVIVLAIAWRAWRGAAPAAARVITAAALGLVALQGAAAGAAAALQHPDWLGPVYLATLTPLWAAMLALVFVAGLGTRVVPAMATVGGGSGGSGIATVEPGFDLPAVLGRLRQTAQDYLTLTKPGIMSLLLTTTLGAMLIAAAGLPPFWLLVATLVGGALASGGASALNCYIDRDIDARMTRTRSRPSAAGRISPQATLRFGVALSAIAVVELWIAVNPLAAVLALIGNLFYVLVYTYWLKRRTPQNIVIGGAAGAVPPLVGWAAVTGELSILAWGLFAIIFLWTPPHFWSLALLKQGEYGRVGVPMLPNVAGEAATRTQIALYTAALFVLCVAMTPFGLGWIYLVGTIAVNGVFLFYALRLYLNPSKAAARAMFFYSLWYLALAYGVAVVDRFVLG